jgi:hypothetical protein
LLGGLVPVGLYVPGLSAKEGILERRPLIDDSDRRGSVPAASV